MSESVRGRLLPPTVERREWLSRHILALLAELALVWVLVFGILIVLLSVAGSALHGAGLSIAADAARGATLVDVAILILLNLLPSE